MGIKQLLSAGNWVFCNKTLAKAYGLEAAAIIGLFCSQQELSGGWFVYTFAKVEEELGIKEHSTRKAVQLLIEHGVIETRRAGNPCKSYYRVNEFRLGGMFSLGAEEPSLVPPKTQPLVPPKTQPLVPPKTQPLFVNKNTFKDIFKNTYVQTQFARVWDVYPRKVSKQQAETTFQKLFEKGKLPKTEKLISSIQEHAKTSQWQTIQHIPHLSTYLNGANWEDIISPAEYNSKPMTRSGSKQYTSSQQEYRTPKQI